MEKSSNVHSVFIREREALEISGVADVLAFDENSALLKGLHDIGLISIEGEGLHMSEMDAKSGVVKIDGKISSLSYIDKNTKKSGLFRSGK